MSADGEREWHFKNYQGDLWGVGFVDKREGLNVLFKEFKQDQVREV